MNTLYQPPADIWEVNARLQFSQVLDLDDPRWVDTRSARGENTLLQLGQALGVYMSEDMSERELKSSPERGCYLFCGHVGSGKSTELRRIGNYLGAPEIYYVVFTDAAEELDINNLRYQDVLFHLAGKLMKKLEDDGIIMEQVHLRKLQDWFLERVENETKSRELAREIKAGTEAGTGIPGLVKMFVNVSNGLKTNATYKVELRNTLKNYFTDFANAFTDLIESAEEAIRAAGKGRRILFVVDGTDRLSRDDAAAFFISDVHQLKQVYGLFIYCAPVHLGYESMTIRGIFEGIFRLPMIKLVNQDYTTNQVGREVMREMLHKRAASDLFEDGVADILVEYSGGHPRELLRLLQTAFIYTKHGRFDEASVRRAVQRLAGEFQYFLEVEDYKLLAMVDSGQMEQMKVISARTRKLLYNLSLLEYNSLYWRSHPLIRETDMYRAARRAL